MKQIPKIYSINKGHYELKEIKNTKDIIQKIFDVYTKKNNSKFNFNLSEIQSIIIDNFTYYLFTYNIPDQESDWSEFFPKELTTSTNFTQQKLSLLLFIEANKNIYLLIGGNAYRIIVPFINHSFGLNSYSRIMSPAEDRLASIKTRGITGQRLGMDEQFRNDYRIMDYVKFGKIPKEIHLKLGQQITNEHFSFLKSNKNDRIQISVGKAFKIKKSVDFNNLHKIIIQLAHFETLTPSDYLSSYKEIKDEKFINQFLKAELIFRIFNDISNIGKNKNTLNRFEFDFCNPNNSSEFYEADEYKIKVRSESGGYTIISSIQNREEIYEEVIRTAINETGNNNQFDFMVFLQGVKISCIKDGKTTVSSNFLYHISTEIEFEKKPYFLIDTKWYQLRDSFVNDLKVKTVETLNMYNAPAEILHKVWDKTILDTEKKYNLQYNHEDNYFVFDTIIIDGIELCDVMYFDNDNIYLCHIKYGFKANMRELTNQILISAKRLKEAKDLKENNFLRDAFLKLKNKGHQIHDLSTDDFVDLFHSNRKIKYILGFTSHLSLDLEVRNNIDSFDSNIAKHQIIQCSSEMRSNYFDLFFHQILREQKN